MGEEWSQESCPGKTSKASTTIGGIWDETVPVPALWCMKHCTVGLLYTCGLIPLYDGFKLL